jgi:hypothetical protein
VLPRFPVKEIRSYIHIVHFVGLYNYYSLCIYRLLALAASFTINNSLNSAHYTSYNHLDQVCGYIHKQLYLQIEAPSQSPTPNLFSIGGVSPPSATKHQQQQPPAGGQVVPQSPGPGSDDVSNSTLYDLFKDWP